MAKSSSSFISSSGRFLTAIRASLALSLSLFLSGGAAMPILHTPANVAWRLYFDCINGALLSAGPDRKNEIDKFVVGLDEYCLQWTAIWYSAIQSDAIDSWTPDNQVRFESRRVVMIAILKRDLLLVTPK